MAFKKLRAIFVDNRDPLKSFSEFFKYLNWNIVERSYDWSFSGDMNRLPRRQLLSFIIV
jgi:hypothetical protein